MRSHLERKRETIRNILNVFEKRQTFKKLYEQHQQQIKMKGRNQVAYEFINIQNFCFSKNIVREIKKEAIRLSKYLQNVFNEELYPKYKKKS